MVQTLTAQELHRKLLDSNILQATGFIKFSLDNVSVTIDTTDTVGITLQAWLKQWLIANNIYFSEPANTQEFPDFYLSSTNKEQHMLEVKAFNYNATPAFDIANFESYCSSVQEKAYRLDADYLIFGYSMDSNGSISIKNIWLKKIWQIAGTSERFALKTQVKRDMIYNIRPSTNFKSNTPPPFRNKEDFIKAIYCTLYKYKNEATANQWLHNVISNYKHFTSQDLILR